MKTASVALALFLAVWGTASCDVRVNDKGDIDVDINEGGRAEDESTHTYPLSKGGRVDIETSNGDLELEKATGTAVEVHARRSVRAKTDEEAKELLKEQYFTVETAPDRVTIRKMKAEGVQAFRRRVRLDFRVSVPAGTTVTMKNENGSVTLNGVDGMFTVALTNGRVFGRGVSGGFDAETVNGTVILEMAAVTQDTRIRTVNGHALVGLPANANVTVDASSINGGVIVHDNLQLQTTTKERQHLSGRLGKGGPRIELQTTNGNVRIGAGKPPT